MKGAIKVEVAFCKHGTAAILTSRLGADFATRITDRECCGNWEPAKHTFIITKSNWLSAIREAE